MGHVTPHDFRALTATVLQTMPDLQELAALALNHSEEVHQKACNCKCDAQKEQSTRCVAQVFGEEELMGESQLSDVEEEVFQEMCQRLEAQETRHDDKSEEPRDTRECEEEDMTHGDSDQLPDEKEDSSEDNMPPSAKRHRSSQPGDEVAPAQREPEEEVVSLSHRGEKSKRQEIEILLREAPKNVVPASDVTSDEEFKVSAGGLLSQEERMELLELLPRHPEPQQGKIRSLGVEELQCEMILNSDVKEIVNRIVRDHFEGNRLKGEQYVRQTWCTFYHTQIAAHRVKTVQLPTWEVEALG